MTDTEAPATDTARPGPSELMRALGLLVDGPAHWGKGIHSRAAGVFVIELPGGASEAPIDTVAVRRWIERVPALTLDGERPTAQEVARRLAEFWLPTEPILYVGRTARAIGNRVASMYATPLGDTKPLSAGHWLKTLSVLGDLRVWWAETDAHEEYEDALLGAVAARNAPVGGNPEPPLPFANLGLTGAKAHGLVDSLNIIAATPSATGSSSAKPKQARAASSPRARRTPTLKGGAARPAHEPTFVSRDGLERLNAELDELRTTTRPQVIARVKAARELGDLRENADYEYARKEQSFVEGRILALEHKLRTGVIIDHSSPVDVVRLGSTVEVETEGNRETYVIVGSTEANPVAGRLSNVSPVGQALVGARAGDEVVVQLPRGTMTYRVIEVR